MAVRWYSVVIDCHDIAVQARWWARVLDWRISYEDDDEVVIAPPHATEVSATPRLQDHGPEMFFLPVPETKTLKNRLHIDLAPGSGDDQATEVSRLEAMGARRINVGQDESKVSWVVMEDPEGNEFCVLTARE